MTVILAEPDHPARPMLERAVSDVFLREYGARPPVFSRRLLGLVGPGGPQAVTGLRFAEDDLFSDVYLDAPVEQALSSALGRAVRRDRIVEFSSMAAPQAGAALPLIVTAIRLCLAAGATVGLFTATRRLRLLLRRSGLGCVDLGPARPDRLRDADRWGSYYLQDPRVTAVPVEGLAGLLGRSSALPPASPAVSPAASSVSVTAAGGQVHA